MRGKFGMFMVHWTLLISEMRANGLVGGAGLCYLLDG